MKDVFLRAISEKLHTYGVPITSVTYQDNILSAVLDDGYSFSLMISTPENNVFDFVVSAVSARIRDAIILHISKKEGGV